MTMQHPLRIDRAALRSDIDALAALTDPDRPWTRRSFTPRFLEGRDWLGARFKELGLEVRLDAAGNLIGRWQAEDAAAPVLMTGSHSDTVPNGGRFDGIAGVLTGLAAIRAMKAVQYVPRHTVELVDFLAEEPSDWGLSCVGSRGMAGALSDTDLALVGPAGETLADAIDRIGGSVANLRDARRDDVVAFLELHIEQGPVLETEALNVGIVTAIAGISRVHVRFTGVAAHAGTAPMAMRADAGLALARFALAVREAALAEAGNSHFTATIGVQHVEPGGANVVPGAAEAIVDMRAEDAAGLDRFLAALSDLAESAAHAENCSVRTTLLSKAGPVKCDAYLCEIIASSAQSVAARARRLVSGAGHDAAFAARLAPAAMIFVPSLGGRSHCPEEWTDPDALALGADVLLNSLLLRDRDLPGTGRTTPKGSPS